MKSPNKKFLAVGAVAVASLGIALAAGHTGHGNHYGIHKPPKPPKPVPTIVIPTITVPVFTFPKSNSFEWVEQSNASTINSGGTINNLIDLSGSGYSIGGTAGGETCCGGDVNFWSSPLFTFNTSQYGEINNVNTVTQGNWNVGGDWNP